MTHLGIAALIGCFPGKTLWCGASEDNAFKGIVNFFSGGLDFTPLEFDNAAPDPDWVVATSSSGQLGSSFTGLLEVSSRMNKTLKLTKYGYKSIDRVIIF